MIKIESNYNKYTKGSDVVVTLRMKGDTDDLTKELACVLKCIDDKYPLILMGAIDLNIKDIIDEVGEGGEDD